VFGASWSFFWFFGNFREAWHGSRRDRQAEYYAHEDADNAGHNGQSTDKKRFFRNFRETQRGKANESRPTIVRQAGLAECYAHEDADKAGHNGHSPDNKQRLCFVLSCPSCPRGVRVFMSVSLSSAGSSLTIHGS